MPNRPRNKRIFRPNFKIPGGYRLLPGIGPKLHKTLMKRYENQKVLNATEHQLVQKTLDKCTKEIKDKEGKVKDVKILASPHYIARLVALLDKPIKEAKVDGKGNPWEKPKPKDKETKKTKVTKNDK